MDVASSSVFGDEDVNEGSNGNESPYLASQQDDAASSSEFDGAEDGSDDRPRFQGSDKAYRDYIAKERRLLASLQTQDSSNLSLHLYNTHAWKQRLYPAPADLGQDQFKNKLSWIQPGEDGRTAWHPPIDWTAWPLPPQHPSIRQSEEDRSDSDAFADLLSEVQGLVLHRAKEMLDQREWTSGSGPVPNADRSASPSVNAQDESLSIVHSRSEVSSSPTAQMAAPTFFVDEDEAMDLTRPTAQHIVAKVDDLLGALHISRRGHRLEKSHRSRDPSRSRSRSKTPGNASHTSKPVRRPRSPGPGLRDWSDVLGVATLAGWDTEVIHRTLQRCSSLFGERMTFRKMPETPFLAGEGDGERVQYRPEPIREPIEEQDDSDQVSQDSDPALDEAAQDDQGHPFCPFPDCARSIVAYDKLWRWREHLKRAHMLSAEQVAAVEARNNFTTAAAPMPEEDPQSEPAGGFPCPYEECPRHREPYAVRWRLTEHLKRGHGHSLEDARRLIASGLEETHDLQDSARDKTEDQGETALDRPQDVDNSQQSTSRKRRVRG